MNPNEASNLIHDGARALLDVQCDLLGSIGVGSTMFLGADSGVVDRQGRKVRAVLFLSTGAFSNDDLRRLKEYCLGFSQDGMTPGERVEKVRDVDNLKPKDGEEDPR